MTTKGMKFGPMSAERKAAISKAKKGIPLSDKDRERVKAQFAQLNRRQVGDAHPRWRGTLPSYTGVHKWLERKFGKAFQCLNRNCEGQSKTFQWAKLRDATYERFRANFTMLCASCHQQYDKNPKFQIDL